jgi:hypothetical protein
MGRGMEREGGQGNLASHFYLEFLLFSLSFRLQFGKKILISISC